MKSNDTHHILILAEKIKKLNPKNPLLHIMRERFKEIQNEQNPKQKEMGS